MSEQERISRTRRETSQPQDSVETTAQPQTDDGFDALLDEIDGLLETNAADYVRSFVQKGGQ